MPSVGAHPDKEEHSDDTKNQAHPGCVPSRYAVSDCSRRRQGARILRQGVRRDRDGYIVDPFGHGWTIATHVEDVDPEDMGRRMAELQQQS